MHILGTVPVCEHHLSIFNHVNIIWFHIYHGNLTKIIWFFVVHFPNYLLLHANLRLRYAVIYHCFWSDIDLLEHEKLLLAA